MFPLPAHNRQCNSSLPGVMAPHWLWHRPVFLAAYRKTYFSTLGGWCIQKAQNTSPYLGCCDLYCGLFSPSINNAHDERGNGMQLGVTCCLANARFMLTHNSSMRLSEWFIIDFHSLFFCHPQGALWWKLLAGGEKKKNRNVNVAIVLT